MDKQIDQLYLFSTLNPRTAEVKLTEERVLSGSLVTATLTAAWSFSLLTCMVRLLPIAQPCRAALAAKLLKSWLDVGFNGMSFSHIAVVVSLHTGVHESCLFKAAVWDGKSPYPFSTAVVRGLQTCSLGVKAALVILRTDISLFSFSVVLCGRLPQISGIIVGTTRSTFSGGVFVK